MILGLTGSIGSGKSTVSNFFLEMGFKIFDADIIAKNILNSEKIKKEIQKEFGEKYIDSNGNINTKKLKEEVFNNKERLKKLNSLIHPKVRERFEELRDEYKNKNEIIVFDVPLLFEAEYEELCDQIIVVDIDPQIQIERIKLRDNLDEDLIKKIINSQMSREEKLSKAHIVIENNGTVELLKDKVKNVIEKIK